MRSPIIAWCSLLSLVLSLFVSAVAHANPAMHGTWRVAVLKKGKDKQPLASKGFTLVLEFDHQAKTWAASTKGDHAEERKGTYTTNGEEVVLESGGTKYRLRVVVQGNQMILSPMDDPETRLVALKVN
ncbi:MAG: hypothetical protein KC731_40480 [Myxococcales bacterium]|nr:hypothetical protein [Myxococcales bacterium]